MAPAALVQFRADQQDVVQREKLRPMQKPTPPGQKPPALRFERKPVEDAAEQFPVRTRGQHLTTGAAPGIRGLTNRQAELLKSAFLERYAKYGNINYVCDMVHVHRSTFYRWQEDDDQFAAAFRTAEVQALETLEREAWRRAVEGSPYERTSYWHGEPVGTDRKIEYSDQLLTLLLRARAPEKYRDRMDVAVSQVIKTVAGVDPASVL